MDPIAGLAWANWPSAMGESLARWPLPSAFPAPGWPGSAAPLPIPSPAGAEFASAGPADLAPLCFGADLLAFGFTISEYIQRHRVSKKKSRGLCLARKYPSSRRAFLAATPKAGRHGRSEEHTSELQSLRQL